MSKIDRTRARSYGFRVFEEKWADCPSIVIRAMVREGDAESPINPRSEGEDSIWDAPKNVDGLALAGLTIRFYLSDLRGLGVGLRHAEFESVSYVNHRLAKRMAKTFSRIEREVDRAGAFSEIGDYVGAVWRAIGASFYAREIPRGTRSSWPAYADSDWTWLDLPALKSEVRAHWARLEALARARGGESSVDAA